MNRLIVFFLLVTAFLLGIGLLLPAGPPSSESLTPDVCSCPGQPDDSAPSDLTDMLQTVLPSDGGHHDLVNPPVRTAP